MVKSMSQEKIGHTIISTTLETRKVSRKDGAQKEAIVDPRCVEYLTTE